MATLARLEHRCEGILDAIRNETSQVNATPEGAILANLVPSWDRADVLSALAGLIHIGALVGDRKTHPRRTTQYTATGSFDQLKDRIVGIAEVLPSLRKHFDQENQASLVVSWPSALETPKFRGWRSSKMVLVEMIDEATKDVVLVFPFIDSAGVGEITSALCRALAREVRVVLLTRYLAQASSANAQLANLLRSAPGGAARFQALNISSIRDPARELLHAKVLVVDDGRRGYVGSANLTSSAFGESIEIGVALDGAAAVSVAELVRELLIWGRSN